MQRGIAGKRGYVKEAEVLIFRNNQLMWGALGVTCIIFVMSLGYGFQYLFEGDSHTLYIRIVTIPFVLVVLGLTLLVLPDWQGLGGEPDWPDYLGPLVTATAFLTMLYLRSNAMAPVSWVIPAMLVLILGGVAYRMWGHRGSNIVYLAAGVAFYVLLVVRFDHAPGTNMLLIIELASEQFFAGRNPYVLYPGVSALPLGYLPGLWLPYGVLHHFGIDVRVINLVSFVLIVLLFEKGLRLSEAKAKILSLTFYPVMLSAPIAQMIVNGHVWPYWVLALSAMLMLAHERYLWAAVLVGVALGVRQTTLFLALPIAFYVYLRTDFRRTSAYGLAALAAYAVVVLPFALWIGREFWQATYLNVAGAHIVTDQVSVANWLARFTKADSLRIIQLLILAAWLGVIGWRWRNGVNWFLCVSGLTVVWLTLFNAYVARYVYIPGFLLVLMGLSMKLGGVSGAGKVPRKAV